MDPYMNPYMIHIYYLMNSSCRPMKGGQFKFKISTLKKHLPQ